MTDRTVSFRARALLEDRQPGDEFLRIHGVRVRFVGPGTQRFEAIVDRVGRADDDDTQRWSSTTLVERRVEFARAGWWRAQEHDPGPSRSK